MDDSVLASIKRWPNVPAVFGWLSLSARGQWRLHPDGLAAEGGTGQSITNAQILGFMSRNYAHDDAGRWFFQNGPQRVYVRLDGAAWIIFANDSDGTLTTHTGLVIETVSQAYLDEQGHLYLLTEHGAGMLIDRDLPRFVQSLTTDKGQSLEDWWADSNNATSTELLATDVVWKACGKGLPVKRLDPNLPIDVQLGFVANPIP